MSTKLKPVKASWDDKSEFGVLNIALEHMKQNFSDNGFTSVVLTSIKVKFNEEFKKDYENSQISSKLAEVKSEFKEVDRIRKCSGFGYNYSSNLPTAPDSAWEEWFAVNPKHRKYRTKPFLNYDLCAQLFADKIATGKYAKGSVPIAAPIVSITSTEPIVSATSTASNVSNSNLLYTPKNTFTKNLEKDSSDGSDFSDGTTKPPKRQTKADLRDGKILGIINGIASVQKGHYEKKSSLERSVDIINEEYPHLTVRQKYNLKILFKDEKESELFNLMFKDEREMWVDDELER
jgi:hypothetical protein